MASLPQSLKSVYLRAGVHCKWLSTWQQSFIQLCMCSTCSSLHAIVWEAYSRSSVVQGAGCAWNILWMHACEKPQRSSDTVYQMLVLSQRTTEVMDKFEDRLPGKNSVSLFSGPSVAQRMLAISFHPSGKCVIAKELCSFCGTAFCMSCKSSLYFVFRG